MLASSKQKYSKTLAFPKAYYECIINLPQSVELFCAYASSADKEIFLKSSLEIPKNLRFNSAMVSSRFAMVWRRSQMVFCISSPFFVRSAIVLFCCSMIVRKVLISLCRLLLFDMIYHLFISTGYGAFTLVRFV